LVEAPQRKRPKRRCGTQPGQNYEMRSTQNSRYDNPDRMHRDAVAPWCTSQFISRLRLARFPLAE